MNADALFVATLKDLASRLGSGAEYDIVRASGLVRHLLLDPPLIHKVNRSRQLSVRFRVAQPMGRLLDVVNDPPDLMVGLFEEWGAVALPGIELLPGPPGLRPDVEVVELTLDQFLAHEIGLLKGVPFSVKTLIRYVAHVAGGVHDGPPNSEQDKALLSFESMVPVDPSKVIPHFRPVVGTMLGLGVIVVDALSPLLSAVQGDESGDQ